MHERAMSESDFSLALQGSQSVILADSYSACLYRFIVG